jgi:hypothetical protein
MKIRFGQTATGSKTHLIVGNVSCPAAAWKILTTVKLGDFTADDVCFYCRRIANLEAASRSNCFGPGWSKALDRLLSAIEPVYNAAYLRELAAEIADYRKPDASRGSSGAMFRKVEPVTVVEIEPAATRPKSAFAEAVARMGVRSVRTAPRRRPATKRTANAHARFAA